MYIYMFCLEGDLSVFRYVVCYDAIKTKQYAGLTAFADFCQILISRLI